MEIIARTRSTTDQSPRRMRRISSVARIAHDYVNHGNVRRTAMKARLGQLGITNTKDSRRLWSMEKLQAPGAVSGQTGRSPSQLFAEWPMTCWNRRLDAWDEPARLDRRRRMCRGGSVVLR
ncbi:uncharacterized protein LOC112460050 [Temnothorax curvispinosus]|uniref:Uncharacterized protein LOC112460050 n=1 Tax=Temnothorax curvispinosus TaxID=300111 RepID=A0A6J1QD60_9HYME|nr:uncharacterized protein LOC112460050 [Temnothorax curvispinosus]